MPALPTYVQAAQRYNQRVTGLGRFRARVNLEFTYTDEDGQRRTENPDGTLQVIRPDRLALTLNKVGKTLFWVGCDPERSWFIDLSGDDAAATIGTHAAFEREAARRLGLIGRPLDQILVLGITPLDLAARGAVERGRNGEIGISAAISSRGIQRIWVDPATYRPLMIQLFDAAKRLVVQATLSGEERVELRAPRPPSDPPGELEGAAGGERPWIPNRVYVRSLRDDSTLRITMSGATDERISDKAFDFDAIVRTYEVQRIDTLDQQGSQPASR